MILLITNNFVNCKNRIESVIEWLKKENKQVILYGGGYCGYETTLLMKKFDIPIVAICDDYRVGEYLQNIKFSKISDVSPNENTIIFITSGFNEVMKNNLKKLNLYKYYVDVDFGRYEPQKENYNYFINHQEELEKSYSLLKDSKSKRIFTNLVNYRISRDLVYLDNMMETTPQYFPNEKELNLMTFGQNTRGGVYKHIFLDCGAYDGDTIRAFLNYVDGNYEKIIAVESSKKNYTLMKNNLIDISNIEYHNIGIFNKDTQLHFTINDKKNSFIDECGEVVINVNSIDNILKKRLVTFIKMDIEGAEYEALLGAEYTLKKYNPILAISVYHKVEDLYRLQLLIEKICPNTYNYYLRHYSPTVIETILYAVPKDRRRKVEYEYGKRYPDRFP